MAPAAVTFRGSFARDAYDEFSDVDLLVVVRYALTQPVFTGLEAAVQELYGPAVIRYDPDFEKDCQAQDVRISF